MNLPKINVPTYDLTLPLTKKNIKFRPFLVKEQKILLMAVESEDSTFINDNVKQILKNCCLSDINIDKLPVVDIEYFFLNLRARSVGEDVTLKYRCQNAPDGENKCLNVLEVDFNLLDINIDSTDIKDKIELTNTVGIKMKYPTYGIIEKLNSSKDDSEIAFDIILDCIEFIYDQTELYNVEDISRQELTEFLENLNIDQFKKIQQFFENIPKLQKDIVTKCSKCGFEHKIHIEGLENFFE